MEIEALDLEFKSLISAQLEKKKSSNPGYSSRALARDIGVCPTVLFRFMNKERELTPLFAYKAATYFNFDKDQMLEVLVTTITKDKTV